MKLLMTNFCPYMVCVPNFMQNNHFPGIMEGDYAPIRGEPIHKRPILSPLCQEIAKVKVILCQRAFWLHRPL